jgi:hypothetical protein
VASKLVEGAHSEGFSVRWQAWERSSRAMRRAGSGRFGADLGLDYIGVGPQDIAEYCRVVDL